ncbi:MAG: hypothetical protein PWR03_1885 [Tenuifilum sp.]|jgi:ABC-type transport system involved in cytochrome c biogenesis permease subunit|nr:hypothetical protein [Tenuifilum sp.]
MIWNFFVPTAIISIVLWLLAIILLLKKINKKGISFLLGVVGTLLLLIFIIFYWIDIDRPPMRTMAETRLWYSFLVSLVSLVLFKVYKNKILFSLGLIMSTVFLIVDILHPEYHGKYLMPALQSSWFVPHVVVYMIAYAILAASSLSVIAGLFTKSDYNNYLIPAMNLVYPGFAFLTVGMLLGAFWAKIAWGDYWAWDPKETWALLTWLFYLIVIHVQKFLPNKKKLLSNLLVISFVVLLVTWLGIKYLPSAMQSIHVYGG